MLWIQVHTLWIQGLKRLVLWTRKLTLLEDQGLWIQAIVLHSSCAKAASIQDSQFKLCIAPCGFEICSVIDFLL